MPNIILRAEGAALLAMAILAYAQTTASWGLFALLLFVPDVAMLGYLKDTRIGAVFYNLVHTTLLPLGLLVAGWAVSLPLAISLGLIWLGHIGFDRMLGFGLKYGDAFRHSHLSGFPQTVTTQGAA